MALKGKGATPKHIRDTINRSRRLVGENRWTIVEDVTPLAFEKWRAQQKCSPKTANEYLNSIRAFLHWLGKTKGIPGNGLDFVQKAETRGREVKKRRAWTEE